MTSKPTKGKSIDELFDEGTDMTEFIVEGSGHHVNRDDDEVRKVNLAMPNWIVAGLDREARHLAVSRQAIINMWLAEKLESRAGKDLATNS